MRLLRRVFYFFGYELISTRKSPTLYSHLENIFKLYRIDVVLDVGANTGQFATLIREMGYRGDIYSF